MEIKAPDGTAVYMGNGRETTECTLNVPMDGVYPIVVEGQRAKGRIRVDVEKAPELTSEELASPWHVYRPGCLEHYVLYCLRSDPAFVPKLDFVMEKDGKLIGQVIYMRAFIDADEFQSYKDIETERKL